MTREQYSDIVKNIMTHKNPYGAYHKKNFDDYASYGESAPINSDIINNMPNAVIILTDEVYGALLGIRDVTVETNKEVPFFLYGKETSQNIIEFNELMTASDERQTTEADYNDVMVKDLQDKISKNLNNNFVVSHGHSHPPIGPFYENFSLGDFISYIQMNLDNEPFKKNQIELTGCLVTPSGDINFVFYDNQRNNFYRFTNLYKKNKDGKLIPINCYKQKNEVQEMINDNNQNTNNINNTSTIR